MWVLLITSVCAIAPWAADVGLRPRKTPALHLIGDGAPTDLVAVKRGRRVKLRIDGPANLTLQVYGIRKRRGRRYRGPGKAIVKLGRSKRRVNLSAEPYPGVKIKRHPLWRLTAPETITFDLGPGRHRLMVIATRSTPLGIGLVARVGRSSAEAPLAEQSPAEATPAHHRTFEAAPAEAPPAGTEGPRISGAAAASPTPAVVADESAPPAEAAAADEPPLAGGGNDELEPAIPTVAPTHAAANPVLEPPGPAFTILGQSASPVEVVEPDSVSVFNRVGSPPQGDDAEAERVPAEAQMQLRVQGPGTMLFDIHAFRDADHPSTLAPLVIGLLVDDILIATQIIDQPVDDRYHVPDADDHLSERVTLRLPVEPEEHGVTLTVSDEATLGVLVRPRFQEVERVAEPVVLTAETARAQDLIAEAPPSSSRSRIAVLGGAWVPSAVRSTGGIAYVEGEWGFTAGTARFGLGLAAGFARAATNRATADPRFPSGQSEVELTTNSIPIAAFARWSFDAVDWLELTLSAGGGVVVGWVQMQDGTTIKNSEIGVTPAALFALTALFRVGPGGIALRGQYIPALGLKNATVTSFSPGGAAALAGYVLEF